MAGELLMSISQDERERAIFRNRRIALADLESNMITVRREGVREGRLEGILEGRLEGIALGEEQEREKWQDAVAERDAEIARLRAMLGNE